jgi:hypothetical protein
VGSTRIVSSRNRAWRVSVQSKTQTGSYDSIYPTVINSRFAEQAAQLEGACVALVGKIGLSREWAVQL